MGSQGQVAKVHGQKKAMGTASIFFFLSILAIGTGNPSNVVEQSTFPDFYFRVTNSDHKQHLKDKFRRICEKSTIKKRHLYIDVALNSPPLRPPPRSRSGEVRSRTSPTSLTGPRLLSQLAMVVSLETRRTDHTRKIFVTQRYASFLASFCYSSEMS